MGSPKLEFEELINNIIESFIFSPILIWGKAGERQKLFFTKILKNKGKYIVYMGQSSNSDP